ncbi:MAG: nucleoside-diphosphate kinase [Methanomicrobiales archaeon]|nr:nucleoside-diphosphate kinase [Methanomicrobiales archaeon]
MEQTFVMVKPDGVARGIVGQILTRFEARGLKIVAAQLLVLDEARVNAQYQEHEGKPFYPYLKAYIMSGPCFLMVLEGKGAVKVVRCMVGQTDPQTAASGTIRGDFALDLGRNVIHASDSLESAAREIRIHFAASDLFSYIRTDEAVLYET